MSIVIYYICKYTLVYYINNYYNSNNNNSNITSGCKDVQDGVQDCVQKDVVDNVGDGVVDGGVLESNNTYDTVDTVKSDSFGYIDSIVKNNTTIPFSDAMNIFHKNESLRLFIYYHGINNIIISASIHRMEMVSIGKIKLLYKYIIDKNIIYVGCLIDIYNTNTSFYMGDFIKSDNINFTARPA